MRRTRRHTTDYTVSRATRGHRAALSFVLAHIREHRLSPGDYLPSVRRLTTMGRLSPNSVTRAIAQLRTMGIVATRPGRGTLLLRNPDSGIDTDRLPADTGSRQRWQQVRSAIRTAVINGRYPAGAMLPGSKELTAEYGVCFRTLRKATASLCREGVLGVNRKHLYVTPISPSSGPHTVVLLARMARERALEHMPERSLVLLRELEHVCSLSNLRLVIVPCDYVSGSLVPLKPELLTPRAHHGSVLGYIVWALAMDEFDVVRFALDRAAAGARVAVLDDTGSIDLTPLYRFRQSVLVVSMAISSRCGLLTGRYLMNRGHRRLAYVSSSSTGLHTMRRLDGLRSAGRELDPTASVPHVNIGFDTDDELRPFSITDVISAIRDRRLRDAVRTHTGRIGATLTDSLLLEHARAPLTRLLRDNDATCWVAADDRTACACLDFLAAAHVAVPDRLSVVGFDDTTAATLHNLDSYNFNYRAVTNAMVSFVAGHSPGTHERGRSGPVEIDGTVVARGSVGDWRLMIDE
ncbi:MAG: GntR family transcriptional regulator [Chitinivibrionales bacterium]|nr:GntR family transcriptional regulator [Chitinivibrionales bacterium]